MAEYCSEADVKKRATASGWSFIADRDRDGRVDATEQTEVDYARLWAGRKIDAALAKFIQPSEARGQGNEYLKDICVDLAVYRLWTNGGDEVPRVVERDFDDATDALSAIENGRQVPGLTFNPPYPSAVLGRVPRAYMPR